MTAYEGVHDPGYFTGMYAGAEDPWGFDSRWYERRKYALTVAALPLPLHRRAVEPGCANGALTHLLADRCEELHSFDLVPEAVARARTRLAGRPHVEVRQAAFPEWWPPGTGDLVIWSEVAYYLGEAAAQRALEGLDGWLETDGHLVAVHWTGPTDYPRSGRAIGPWLDGAGFLTRTSTLVEEQFELGVWRRSS